MHCGRKHQQPFFLKSENELYFEEFYDARSNSYIPWAPVVTS